MSRCPLVPSALAFLAASILAPAILPGAPIVFSAAGADAASIAATVDAFRVVAGSPNNGSAPGPLPGGRREINWDGGGSVLTTISPTPFSGFLDTRGALFTTPGTGFIQATPDGLALEFGNPTYLDTFAPFSPARLFSPVGSNVTDATFAIPGTAGSEPATVSAFGAVFSDVDTGATTFQFFGIGGESLGAFTVPSAPGDRTFSFLGVAFDGGERIAQVRITTGNAALGPNDAPPGIDVVVMDDFIFSEPRAIAAVPEPSTLLLVALGLLGAGAARRRAS